MMHCTLCEHVSVFSYDKRVSLNELVLVLIMNGSKISGYVIVRKLLRDRCVLGGRVKQAF